MKTIITNLKVDLDVTAKEYGAITKIKELKCGGLLLQLLFIYTMGAMSFSMIFVIAYVMCKCNISDEAWRQRFNKCNAWLLFLLESSLIEYSPMKMYSIYIEQQMQVYLLDASTVKQVGKNGRELRLHTCYNYTKGAIEEVVITDNHTAEGTNLFKIEPLSLYIANALFRLTPNQVKLCGNAKGVGKVNMLKRLKTKKNNIDFRCFIHYGRGKYSPVRIIASRLPEDKILGGYRLSAT